MIWVLVVLAVLVLTTFIYLRGPDLGQFDLPPGQSFDLGHEPSDEHDAVVASFDVGIGPVQRAPRRQRLALMREYMDGISETQDYHASFTPADAGGVKAEWVQAPGVSSKRRVLYIHGGAFVMGSPKSHRNITSRFSEIANASVLAIDYRLMPENSRKAGIQDCRTAYRWIVENGPDGPQATERVFIGGDSAGGNLTLSLISWVRDQPLRPARRGGGPVARDRYHDGLAQPQAQHGNRCHAGADVQDSFAWVPRPLLWWIDLFCRIAAAPVSPVMSPVYGDLSGLPPTLVHASEAELVVR